MKPKQIKWTAADSATLKNEIRRFNRKIDRLAAENPSLIDLLPEKQGIRKIRGEVETRAELNRTRAAMERFTRPGAEQIVKTDTGVAATKWELRNIGIQVGIINRRRAAELKAAAPATERGTMGTVQDQNLRPKPFHFQKMKSAQEWEKYKESVQKQARSSYSYKRMELYKENYLKALNNTFGEKAAPLIERLKKLPADKLMKGYYNDPILQTGFIYDPLSADMILDAVIGRWNDFLDF